MANVRPGDLLICLDDSGYLTHVCICSGYATGHQPTTKISTTDACSGTNGYVISWNNRGTAGANIDVYTAYPD